MLENPSQSDLPPSNPASAPIKRYAPPNQRSRGLNRRKSGDRLEKTSSFHGSDMDKNITTFRNVPSDARGSNSLNEGHHRRLIALNGCARSEASQLLHERWEATINSYNDPEIDLSERPVMYTSSPAPAWSNFRLPHQLMSGPQMDFLGELRQALQKHNANSTVSSEYGSYNFYYPNPRRKQTRRTRPSLNSPIAASPNSPAPTVAVAVAVPHGRQCFSPVLSLSLSGSPAASLPNPNPIQVFCRAIVWFQNFIIQKLGVFGPRTEKNRKSSGRFRFGLRPVCATLGNGSDRLTTITPTPTEQR